MEYNYVNGTNTLYVAGGVKVTELLKVECFSTQEVSAEFCERGSRSTFCVLDSTSTLRTRYLCYIIEKCVY